MDTNVVFSTDDWDETADISPIHLSYIIQSLLPMRLIAWERTRRHYDGIHLEPSATDPPDMSTDLKENDCIVTGSTAEGFAIPNSLSRSRPNAVVRFSDVDMLVVHTCLLISTEEFASSDNTAYKAFFDREGVPPGYTRLCIPSFKNKDGAFILDEERNKYYLSGSVYMERIITGTSKLGLEPTETAFVQGPALSIEDSQVLSLQNWGKFNAGSSRDVVSALPCSPWPKEALAWRDRAVKSGWMSEEMAQSIIDDGCHVVAVPSKKSARPDLDWRISFSSSEGKLARDVVTDHQRQCYIYLKILRYQIMKPVTVLSSYVFKSVFLHCCEMLPRDAWQKHPGNCILYMLDLTLECLQKKHVPTYFLPENNLVAHLNDEEMAKAIEAVEKMRHDPIGPVMDFTDDIIVGLQSVYMPFRNLCEPLLKDMGMFKVHRTINFTIMHGILPTAINLCQSLLSESSAEKDVELTKHVEAVKILIDVYNLWFVRTNLMPSLLHFINCYGLSMKDQRKRLRFYEAVVNLSAEYPEFKTETGNLACMYHACAYSTANQEERALFLSKAAKLFEDAYKESKHCAIDYVAFLTKQQQFEKAILILEECLASGLSAGYSYNENEANALEDPLKSHVLQHHPFSCNAQSLAYYFLVKCKCCMEPKATQEVLGILEKFERHCESQNTESSKLLLQFARTIAEECGVLPGMSPTVSQ